MIERTGQALGSRLRLVIPGSAPKSLVDAAWAAVRDVFADVDRAMSGFRDDSDITRLHRSGGRGSDVSPALREALVLTDRANRVTAGRFDPRVIVDLERLGFPGARPGGFLGPREGRIVSLDHHEGSVRLAAPVDLGGIGKGLALRWARKSAASALRHAPFLVDAGGDIAANEAPRGGPWQIAIEDARGGEAPIAVIRVAAGGAVATSSVRVARRRAPDGTPVHHLIDPRSGQPGGDGLLAVTVAGTDPAWAEVWSKALFLEGSRDIAAVARARGLAAWWVDAADELSMTPGARQLTIWVRDEAAPRAMAS